MPLQKSEKEGTQKFWKGFYVVTAFIGLVLLGFEILLFRQTMIDNYIPISIILIVGYLTFHFNKTHYKKVYQLRGNFFPLIQNIISWGFIACFMFMAGNYYWADHTTQKYTCIIKEKNSMVGLKGQRDKRQPLVTIDYLGFEKELVFRFEETEMVNKADSVFLTIKKGGFGFDILDDYETLPKGK